MKTRKLKIEKDGDFWRGKIKPKIRLKGCWLEQAGFKPGNHVTVKSLAPGVIELSSNETALTLCETFRQIALPGLDYL